MIAVRVGALADQVLEGVLCPIRSDLTPVSAAGRDLTARAGEAMTGRLDRMGSLPLGGAVITPGGGLPASFVIHAVVASDDEPETALSAQRALRNALRRAVDMGIESLALPPLAMGVGILEAEESARAMVEILQNHLDEGHAPTELAIVVPSEYEASVFERLVAEVGRER